MSTRARQLGQVAMHSNVSIIPTNRFIARSLPKTGGEFSPTGGCSGRILRAPFRFLSTVVAQHSGHLASERLTQIRIFEELRALGYEGSYDTVRRYAKRWRAERGGATAEAYVPLSFASGEAWVPTING